MATWPPLGRLTQLYLKTTGEWQNDRLRNIRRGRFRSANAVSKGARRLVKKFDRSKPFAGDLKVEDVKAIVVADHIMELLRLDALRHVDVLIKQPF